MKSILDLRKVFRFQLISRGIISAVVTLFFIFLLGVITADLKAWWFDALPILRGLATWIKAQDPWNFFILIFLFVNIVNILQQVQGVFIDRHNAKILINKSAEELEQSDDPAASMGKRRAMMNGRRRMLESLYRFEPLTWSIGALVIAFIVLHHYLAAAALIAEVAVVFFLLPRMIRKFDAIRSLTSESEDEEGEPEPRTADSAGNLSPEERKARRLALQDPEERARRSKERAESNLADAAERMMALVNRPLIRLKIGWPVIVTAAATVALITVSTISEMSLNGDLPARATLLIMLLAFTANYSLRFAQMSEDLAFFASALDQITNSPDGAETI